MAPRTVDRPTPLMLMLLAEIAHQPGILCDTLAVQVGRQKSNIAVVIRGAEALGLVHRGRLPNGFRPMTITQAGYELLQAEGLLPTRESFEDCP